MGRAERPQNFTPSHVGPIHVPFWGGEGERDTLGKPVRPWPRSLEGLTILQHSICPRMEYESCQAFVSSTIKCKEMKRTACFTKVLAVSGISCPVLAPPKHFGLLISFVSASVSPNSKLLIEQYTDRACLVSYLFLLQRLLKTKLLGALPVNSFMMFFRF